MKAIVGVDTGGLYLPALDLLARLRCTNTEVDFVHVTEGRELVHGFGPLRGSVRSEDQEHLREAGKSALTSAMQDAERRHLHAHTTQLEGSSARRLIEYGDSSHSDLIAVGSHPRKSDQELLAGRVGRGLVTGARQSVLIAKRFLDRTGPMKVVFATDHSPYAAACARHLVAWQPAGIQQLQVVTAISSKPYMDDMFQSAHGDVERELRQKSHCLVQHFNEAGIPAEYRLAQGDVTQAVEAAADLADADLVIVGGRGHGFLERLLIGSVSLQIALTLPHNVLILRPRN